MTACNACGDSATQTLFDNQDYISGERFAILRCVGCGLVRTDFTEQDTSRYYDPAYYGVEGRRFPMVAEWAIGWFRRRRVGFVRRQHPQAGRVLDIGCGRGLMLAALARLGWDVVGTEVSATLSKQAFPIHQTADIRTCAFAAQSFDVVMLWHVLEHLPQPIDTLREAWRILKPGGVLIVEVPNLASWQARLGRGAWFHLDAPRHLYHFAADTLGAGDLGYTLVAHSSASLEYGYYGLIQTILNRLTRQPNALYARLKGSRARGATWGGELASLALLPLAILVGIVLESAAIGRGRGGILRVVLQKPHPHGLP